MLFSCHYGVIQLFFNIISLKYIMKKIWFYWIILMLLGCSNDTCDDGNCQIEKCENGTCSYAFFDNSAVKINLTQEGIFSSIEAGENTVFEYKYVKNDKPEIADDELTVFLRFEVPEEETIFEIDNSTFEKYKVIYQRACYCVRADYVYPSNGSIKGKRISEDTWQIKADLEIEYYEGVDPYVVEFDKRFSKK